MSRQMSRQMSRPIPRAALLAAALLGNKYPAIRAAARAFRERQTAAVLAEPDPRNPQP